MEKLFLFIFIIFGFCRKAQNTYKTHTGQHAEVAGQTSSGKQYTGTSDELKGRLNASSDSVTFQLKLKSLDTGIRMRNNHMLNI